MKFYFMREDGQVEEINVVCFVGRFESEAGYLNSLLRAEVQPISFAVTQRIFDACKEHAQQQYEYGRRITMDAPNSSTAYAYRQMMREGLRGDADFDAISRVMDHLVRKQTALDVAVAHPHQFVPPKPGTIEFEDHFKKMGEQTVRDIVSTTCDDTGDVTTSTFQSNRVDSTTAGAGAGAGAVATAIGTALPQYSISEIELTHSIDVSAFENHPQTKAMVMASNQLARAGGGASASTEELSRPINAVSPTTPSRPKISFLAQGSMAAAMADLAETSNNIASVNYVGYKCDLINRERLHSAISNDIDQLLNPMFQRHLVENDYQKACRLYNAEHYEEALESISKFKREELDSNPYGVGNLEKGPSVSRAIDTYRVLANCYRHLKRYTEALQTLNEMPCILHGVLSPASLQEIAKTYNFWTKEAEEYAAIQNIMTATMG